METQPLNNVTPEPAPTAEIAAERMRQRRRKRLMQAMSLERRDSTRSKGFERQSRKVLLLSIARQAVNNAMREPRSLGERMHRDYIIRKWKSYTAALANRNSFFRFY